MGGPVRSRKTDEARWTAKRLIHGKALFPNARSRRWLLCTSCVLCSYPPQQVRNHCQPHHMEIDFDIVNRALAPGGNVLMLGIRKNRADTLYRKWNPFNPRPLSQCQQQSRRYRVFLCEPHANLVPRGEARRLETLLEKLEIQMSRYGTVCYRPNLTAAHISCVAFAGL